MTLQPGRVRRFLWTLVTAYSGTVFPDQAVSSVVAPITSLSDPVINPERDCGILPSPPIASNKLPLKILPASQTSLDQEGRHGMDALRDQEARPVPEALGKTSA